MTDAPPPSLLDWLKYHLGQPRLQRGLRLALAALLAVAGVWGVLTGGGLNLGPLAALVGAGLAAAWAALEWNTHAPSPAGAMPSLALGPGGRPAAGPAIDWQVLPALRLPAVLAVAVLAQVMLTYNPGAAGFGVALYALALAGFALEVRQAGLLGGPRPPLALAQPGRPLADLVTVRAGWLAAAMIASLVAFGLSGDNRFRPPGVLAWVVSVAAWLLATWEWRTTGAEALARARERLAGALAADGLVLRLTRVGLLLAGVLAIGAFFRFARLEAIPPEMTSDHVEKLFDVKDVLAGSRPIYFERNTGREPMQFYFAALLATWLGTGLSHLTLKLTGAVAGFLLLPSVYLLGRELEDEALGLLAALLAAVSFWATAISRVGLRFPLAPLFVAPVLWLLVRAVSHGRRNDYLLAGLLLGAGLYGYSAFRLMPLIVAGALLWLWAWPQPAAARRQAALHTLLMAATAFLVFVPFYRYALEPGAYFWYRSLTRLGGTEQPLAGPVLQVFADNLRRGLGMFNWRGDEVWVNTIPGLPVLDVITGALLVLGAAFLLARLLRRRDRLAGLLLLLVPALMLPSTLSLAFPLENPSAVRASGAIPVVMVIAAYPAWLLWRRLRATLPAAPPWAAGAAVAGLGLAALAINYHLYFTRYPAQYLGAAQNASEIGAVVRSYAGSVGTPDRAYMCLHPHWADTRAVGIYAGQTGWENVLAAPDFARLVGDPRPLLVIVNPRSEECQTTLPQLFPTGVFSLHHSARGPDKDFLLFFVPPEYAAGSRQ